MKKSSASEKRMTVSIDEKLFKEASKTFGEKSQSAVVNRALEEAVKIGKIRRLVSFIGKDMWRGNLSEMRRDVKAAHYGRR